MKNLKTQAVKSFFTTTSAIALIAGTSHIAAAAATRTTTGNNAIIGGANTNLDGAFVNGDDVKIGNAAHTAISTGAAITFGPGGTGIDVDNNAGVAFTINHPVTFSQAADFGSANGGLASVTIDASGSVFQQGISGDLTVNSGNNITLGGAVLAGGGNAGNVTIDNGTLTGTANTNIAGTLTVDAHDLNNTTVNVNDVTGNVSLIRKSKLTMSGSVGGDATISDSELTGTVNTNIGGTLTVDARDLDNTTVNVNNVTGNVSLMRKSKLTMSGSVGGDVTISDSELTGTVNTNIGGTLTIDARDLNNTTVNVNNVTGNVSLMRKSKLTMSGSVGGDVTISDSELTGTVNTNIAGTLTVDARDLGNTTVNVNNVTGNITVVRGGNLTMKAADSNVDISGSDTVINMTTVGGNMDVNASKVTMNGMVGGNLTVSNKATLTGTTNVGGNLSLTGGDLTVNNVTGDVTVSSGGDLTIKAAVSDVNITGAASKVSLATIGGNLDITDGTINITGSVSGNVVVKNATLMGSKTDTNIDGTLQVGSTVVVNKVTGDITVTDGTLTMGAAASSLTANGAGTTVNVTSIGKNLNISNSATVNQGGAIGTDVTIATGGVLNGNTGANTDIVGSLNMDNSAANKVVVNSVGVDVAMLGGTLEVVSIGGEVDMRGGTISKLNQVGGDFAPTAPSNAASKVIVDGVLALQGGKYILPTNGVTEFATAASGLRFNGAAANIEIKTDIDVTAAAGSGSIFVGEDTSFTGRIGTAALPIGSITYDADKIFTYSSTTGKFDLHVAGDIAPPLVLGSGKGGFIARYDGTKEFDRDLGTDALNLKYVSFSPSTGGAASNAILKAGRKIYATELDLYPHEHTGIAVSDATLTVEGNTLIDALITTKANSNLGKVVFTANSTVRQDIGSKSTGRLNEVNFASANIADAIILSGNVYADNIIHKKADLRPTKDITFYGKYDGASSTYTMGLHRLTIAPKDGDPVGTDVGKLVSNAPVTYNFTATETAAGNIFISKGSFDMSNIDSLVINITDLTTTIPTGNIGTNGFACRELPIFHAGDDGSINLIANNNVSFNIASSTNQFVQWSYSDGKILQKVLLGTGNAIVEAALAQAGDDSDTNGNINSIAASLSELTNDLIGAIQDGSTGDFVARLQADLTEVTEHAHSAFQGAMQTVSERISSVSLPGALGTVYNLADNSGDDYTLTGVSAGEDTVDDSAIGRKHGAWSSYSIYSAHQQGLDRRPGYRAISHSATIGGDTMPMEDVTVGASFTFSRTFIRHKDSNLGDRSNTDSYIGSVYAMKEFANHWFVQGVGMYSRTRVKNKEHRGSISNREIARANFNANSFGGELLAGYNYLTQNQTLVVPMVGLEYQRLSKTSYQEYGTRNQNLSVRKSPDDKLDGVIGIRFARNYRAYGYDFTPEIHGYIRHDLLNDRINLEAKLPALAEPLAARSTNEHNRTFYNIGSSVTSAIAGNVDMSLSYDAYLAKRHNARQASVKLRVSF